MITKLFLPIPTILPGQQLSISGDKYELIDSAGKVISSGHCLESPLPLMHKLQSLIEFRENQPWYEIKGRILKWGEDMPPGCFDNMKKNSEVCLLEDASGKPYAWLMVDGFGTIREKRIT